MLQGVELVFVGADHQELPHDMGRGHPRASLRLDDGPCPGEHLVEFAPDPIAGVGLLIRPVDGDDEPVDATPHQGFRPVAVDVVRIGRCAHVEPSPLPDPDEVVHPGVQIGLALEVEVEVDEVVAQALRSAQETGQAIRVEHPGGTGEGTEAARAFRAPQVAGCGRLHAEAHRPGTQGRHGLGPAGRGPLEFPPQSPAVGHPAAVRHRHPPQPVPPSGGPPREGRPGLSMGDQGGRWSGHLRKVPSAVPEDAVTAMGPP